ncbi:FlgD immunoglobulin-like domain containing protein [Adhaeribacter soli]|uniref:T9SS type A sorting domain-containing protein n=1 Tax=Adhaeribacter soli TaxID=2607655 RepID=A0A5N1IVM8_9BACT|nr:T9SS type A sorting domain-containing protein [Adhaeribacter soli]KAA9331999.1 T9SS type A sorting domain-containing protein [Adhaeribacter soli]
MTKKLLPVLICLLGILSGTQSFASHQMASELTYTQIAYSTYVVQLTYHRDCSGATESATYPLKIVSQGCNQGRTINLNKLNPTTGTVGTPYCPSASNTCTSTSVNYQKFTYQATFTFSPAEMNCSDWTLSVLFDGVRPVTVNVPSQPAMYVEAYLRIDNQTQLVNNSAKFNPLTPVVPILNQHMPATLSYKASDEDGDSLSYSLVPALSAANTAVTYNPGYSAQTPLPSSTPFTIDPKTGVISFVAPAYSTFGPDKNKYTVAVKVTEWRHLGGAPVIVGTTTRDMIIIIKDNAANANPTFTSIANNQAINNTDIITVRPGGTLNLQLTGIDSNAGDIVQLTTDAPSVLPGATFTPSSGGNHAGTLTWTPSATVNTGVPYYFTVKVTDNACPLMGFSTQTMAVMVTSSGTATGITNARNKAESILAYPNPFQDAIIFKVNLHHTAKQTLVILNALGQEVDRVSLQGKAAGLQEVTWEKGRTIAKGQYVAKLIRENQVSQTIKFTKL